MDATGTVTKIIKRKTEHGSVYIRLTLDDKHTFKYLHTFESLPNKGDRVTISGVPMVGFKKTNIGGVHIRIEQKEN